MNIGVSQSLFSPPQNYGIVDKFITRSAQPTMNEIMWLKNQGVSDIFNFRTLSQPDMDVFIEQSFVEDLGLKYHSIPSITSKPSEENVHNFLKQIDEVKSRFGKAHIHCSAGADWTGMYSYIYKVLNKLGSPEYNKMEWMFFNYDIKKYPDLLPWAEKLVQKLFSQRIR